MTVNHYLIHLYTDKYGKCINQELADMLVNDFAVTDGSTRDSGKKFSMAEAKSIGEKLSISWDDVQLVEYYLILNMMYSDYFRTAKRYGYTDSTFFGSLAYDWFYDADSSDTKTFDYFFQLNKINLFL